MLIFVLHFPLDFMVGLFAVAGHLIIKLFHLTLKSLLLVTQSSIHKPSVSQLPELNPGSVA